MTEPEPRWIVAANVVLWRRYGPLGQELRPGTKAYKGGSKVFVASAHVGMGHEQLTTIGRGRHTGRWITIDTATRHLYGFRAKLVYTPAVLRRYDQVTWWPVRTEEEAVEYAERLECIAAEQRASYHVGPHPDPCRCHECLSRG
ncbi:hypothetical protein [Streptomyces peucetius]|uniref:Uncharacterized protein n=1 Tax=Streptomyces peucetius TaxID=1950 RepID=A0ABY6IDJ0_STRPE|nr:hypothetical protein [Streptomyces peucetius]UYQ65083.1 hypothetical protein OGH68_28890 [Streptomyces peucetius]